MIEISDEFMSLVRPGPPCLQAGGPVRYPVFARIMKIFPSFPNPVLMPGAYRRSRSR